MNFGSEAIRQINLTERRVDGLSRPEMSPDLISPYLALSGLRGFWPMSAFDDNGMALDLSGNGLHLTLAGSTIFGYDFGIVPYAEYGAGGSDRHQHADDPKLDISGTEAYVDANYRGFTFGAWVYQDPAAGGNEWIMSKGSAGGAGQYWLTNNNVIGQGWRGGIRGPGGDFNTPFFGTLPVDDIWYFLVMRFIPSTEIRLFANMVSVVNVAGPEASIVNTALSFQLAEFTTIPGGEFHGRLSSVFICATAISDEALSSVFQQTRSAFRV